MTTTEVPRPSFWRRASPSLARSGAYCDGPVRFSALGFLVLAGFIAGIFFWGAFNTALGAYQYGDLLHLLSRNAGPTYSKS